MQKKKKLTVTVTNLILQGKTCYFKIFNYHGRNLSL